MPSIVSICSIYAFALALVAIGASTAAARASVTNPDDCRLPLLVVEVAPLTGMGTRGNAHQSGRDPVTARPALRVSNCNMTDLVDTVPERSLKFKHVDLTRFTPCSD
jgi:hypothetical protein